MLEKPDLPDQRIIDSLQNNYGLAVVSLEFLPIGNDSTAWVYKVTTAHNSAYFLKLKRGDIAPASVLIPYQLHSLGIQQIVSAIANQAGELWSALGNFNLILYPYIEGRSGMEIGLSLTQWHELGSILRQLHTAQLPPEILPIVPRESFNLNPHWMAILQSLQPILSQSELSDPFQAELAAFWQARASEITHIIRRAAELGRLLQAKQLPFVLCHADIHTANILVNSAGELFIVDWDGILFAPKERDLMFVVKAGKKYTSEREQAFFSGYGSSDRDDLAIAYYRYEWVVQEFADFAKRVFFTSDLGDQTQQEAVRGFKQLFLAGDVIDEAYQSDV